MHVQYPRGVDQPERACCLGRSRVALCCAKHQAACPHSTIRQSSRRRRRSRRKRSCWQRCAAAARAVSVPPQSASTAPHCLVGSRPCRAAASTRGAVPEERRPAAEGVLQNGTAQHQPEQPTGPRCICRWFMNSASLLLRHSACCCSPCQVSTTSDMLVFLRAASVLLTASEQAAFSKAPCWCSHPAPRACRATAQHPVQGVPGARLPHRATPP